MSSWKVFAHPSAWAYLILVEDFEVSIFLTETSTRHSLLTKQKHFRDLNKKGLQSNSHKLTGDTNDTAIDVEDTPAIRREESDEDTLNLQDLPALQDFPAVEGISEADSLFVDEDEEPRGSKRPRAATNESASASSPGLESLPKRRKDATPVEEESDDKKKMAMETTYDGFAIYGRVLCLVIKRKDKKGKGPVNAGQAMMEDWITSTQMPPPEDDG